MTPVMTHEEAQTLLAAEALDALTGAERDAFLTHVAGCPACPAELGEMHDTAALLAYLTYVTPATGRAASVRERLVSPAPAAATPGAARPPATAPDTRSAERAPREPERDVLAISAGRPSARVPRNTRGWGRGGWLAAAAAILIALGLAATLRSARRDATLLRTELAAAHTEGTELGSRLASRDSIISAMTGSAVRVVELAAARPNAPSGRMFWDQAFNRWTFVAHGLPAARPGRTYQLWLITADQRKVNAGVFATTARGDALYRAEYALARDSLAAVAVTEEPAGGVPQPTGSIVLVGAAGR
ncbi:MAG: anti-sigma factor [Gemmatimonadaceae bacterium]